MVRLNKMRSERGSVAIMVASGLVVMLGFAAFAVDLSDGRQRHAQAQNAADFGALAGAEMLRLRMPPGQAKQIAADYVEANDFDPHDMSGIKRPPSAGSREGDLRCMEVVASENRETAFAKVIGIETTPISARAVACFAPALGAPYTVFAGSTTCKDAITFTGANRTINGNVHTNSGAKIVSNGTTMNGILTYLNGGKPEGNITYNPSEDNPIKITQPLPYPEYFEISHYQPLGEKANLALSQGKYHIALLGEDINHGWLAIRGLVDSDKRIASGLYYTSGDVSLGGGGYSSMPGGVTFVTSNGDINLGGNNMSFTAWDPDGAVLFSNKDNKSCSSGQAVVKVNGNDHSWTGVIFAPNGGIDFSGTSIGSSLYGRLVGWSISLNGSSHNITNNPSYPGRVDGVELVE